MVAAAALVAPRPYRKETRLPAGVLEIHSEIVADSDLAGHPSGSILRMAPDFHGRAAIVVRSNGVRLRDFTIVGNRDTRELRTGLPPYDVPFARFTTGNGVLRLPERNVSPPGRLRQRCHQRRPCIGMAPPPRGSVVLLIAMTCC